MFNVWHQADPSAQQFGTYPQKVDGNLTEALAFAKELAKKNLGLSVFVGCEPCHYGDAEPWLTVTLKDCESEPIIEDSLAICTPSSLNISTKE